MAPPPSLTPGRRSSSCPRLPAFYRISNEEQMFEQIVTGVRQVMEAQQ